METTVHVKTKYYTGNTTLLFRRYADKSVAIQGVDPTDGSALFTATVCLPRPPRPGHVWLKGWSENEGIPEALEAAGIVKLTEQTQKTGYVEAVEAKLLVSPDTQKDK